MEPDFWHSRWAEGRTGWHLEEVNRLLLKHWPGLELPRNATVLVPLCGRSLDMAWLADQGHPVLGVELSIDACWRFFADHGLEPTSRLHGAFTRLEAAGITLLAGDVHALRESDLDGVAAFYDRAALIALPPSMRARYVERVYGRLPAGSRGLLVTLEYPVSEREGPPFAVHEAEVRAAFEDDWSVELLERRDILALEPQFAIDGVSSLHTCVYRMFR